MSEPPSLRRRMRLDPAPTAPATARRMLLDLGLEQRMLSDAQLLVSELVTIELRRGDFAPGEQIAVEAEFTGDVLRVEVCDGRSRPIGARSWGGGGAHGLTLLERVADRWGTRDRERCVWFEIDERTERPPRFFGLRPPGGRTGS